MSSLPGGNGSPRGPIRLRALKLALTDGCNLACAYCYQRVRDGAVLSEAALAAALELADELGGSVVTLTLSGGEPLLVPGSLDVVLARVGRASSPRFDVRVLTNGLLLDPGLVERLVTADVRLQISCDGVAAAQAGRSVGSWPVIAARLAELRRRHGDYWRRRVSVAVTVTRANVAHLPRSVAWLLRRDVRRIQVTLAYEPAAVWSRAERLTLVRAMTGALEVSLRHQRATGAVPVVHLRSTADPAGAPSPCGAPDLTSLYVAADGRVHGCGVLADASRWHPAPAVARRAAMLDLGPVTAPDLAVRWRRLAAGPTRWPRDGPARTSDGRSCEVCQQRSGCLICPVAHDADDHIPAAHCLFERLAARHRRLVRERAPLTSVLVSAGTPPALAARVAARVALHGDG